MKFIRGNTFYLTRYFLFFLIISLQACASTSGVRLEGNDFVKNLPGLWEGRWYASGTSGIIRLKITKIDGNIVHLTGYTENEVYGDTEEVNGRLENGTLLITWPTAAKDGVNEKYTMSRDDSGNLTLNGKWHAKIDLSSGYSRLNKIE